MKQLLIKYLRFSLLVASVFIFAGSARASENKDAGVNTQSGNEVVVTSSTTTSVGGLNTNSVSAAQELTGELATKKPTPSSLKSGNVNITAGADSHKLSESVGADNDINNGLTSKTDALVATLGDDQSSGITNEDTVGQATNLVATDSSPYADAGAHAAINSKGKGMIAAKMSPVSFVSASTVGSDEPAQANNNSNPALPMTHSGMLIASLEQLLLSPNVVQKVVFSATTVAAGALLIDVVANAAIALGSIVLLMIAGFYLGSLRRSGFWHGARSGALLNQYKSLFFSQGLVRYPVYSNRQALFSGYQFVGRIYNGGPVL